MLHMHNRPSVRRSRFGRCGVAALGLYVVKNSLCDR